jgi:hypothetical protein
VVYTLASRSALLGVTAEDMTNMRSASEAVRKPACTPRPGQTRCYLGSE